MDKTWTIGLTGRLVERLTQGPLAMVFLLLMNRQSVGEFLATGEHGLGKQQRGEAMAKRFRDSTIWDDDWYLGLPPKIKCAWSYLCDNCDGTGVLKVSFSLISFRIGEQVTKEELNRHFGDRIFWISDEKLWVVDFIAFQYKTLSVKNHAHRGIMKNIIRLVEGLPLTDGQMTLIRGWEESLMTLKDIGKGLGNRNKEKEEEECEEKKEISEKQILAEVELIYRGYPRKEGKQPGLKTAKAQIRTLQDIQDLAKAVEHYRDTCKRKMIKSNYVLMFSTFMNQWRDWLDPNHGESEDFSAQSAIADLSDIKWGAE